MRILILILCGLTFLALAMPVAAQGKASSDLLKRVEALERTIKKMKQRKKARLGGLNQVPSADSGTATGAFRGFNPAISVNGLFLGTYRSEENDNRNAPSATGLKVQEMELVFAAMVDKYLWANLVLSLPEVDSIEVEESYVDVVVTNKLSLRAGKFFQFFGRHNRLHTHQFPFIDAPLVNEEIFGKNGLTEPALNETGVSFNVLAPVPWFWEWNLVVLQGNNEALLNAPLNDDLAYLVNTRNLWDWSENTTVELGSSFLYGKNNIGGPNSSSRAAGGSLQVRWTPATRLRYQTLIWQTEIIHSWRETGVNDITGRNNSTEKKGGIYSFLQYKFDQNWWIQGRYDFFGISKLKNEKNKNRYTALLAYAPSEFSALRLQYSYQDETVRAEHKVMLQLNFSMGSHAAHQY